MCGHSCPNCLYLLRDTQRRFLPSAGSSRSLNVGYLPGATEEFQRAGIELRSQQWPAKSRQRNARPGRPAMLASCRMSPSAALPAPLEHDGRRSSPARASGMPKTRASRTRGWLSRTRSTSTGDMLAPADDDILLAADESQLVALALPHQVATVAPAIVCRIVDAIRRDPVAHGHVGTTNTELTDLASRHIPAFIIHEPNLHAPGQSE